MRATAFGLPDTASRLLASVAVDAPKGVGRFVVAASTAGVASISFGGERPGFAADRSAPAAAQRHAELAADQLRNYFTGERRVFDLSLDLRGSEFQRAVWRRLTEIPFGETTTYGRLAAELGRPGAARAVGLANHDNPIAIVVPCHRVIGADGSLTGYAGGLGLKRWLLDHERSNAPLWSEIP